jgi:5'-deoxynucleotidase YfbR-like HD superfamily hydrolase
MNNLEKEGDRLYKTKEWLRITSSVKRYGDHREMIHRPDLWAHIRRVAYLSEAIGKYLNNLDHSPFNIDLKRTFNMGYHHDDSEFILPDINSQIKHSFTKEQKERLREQEDSTIRALAVLFYGYKIGSSEYEKYISLHKETQGKQTVKAKIVDIADKWDAACEIMHDIRCGNKNFVKLMDFSANRFKIFSFSCRAFWDILGQSPIFEFDKIPTSSEATNLPMIGMGDLKRPSDVARIMSWKETKGYPTCYRTWAEINRKIFDIRPEKYIFPGWYLALWKKWNYKPSGATTVSGILIP